MRAARRVARGLTLAARWTTHIARAPRSGGSDLLLWTRTTICSRDMSALDLTWFTFSATRFLAARVTAGMSIFEWGGGASTMFFARRGCKVTCVEHDSGWAEHLQQVLGGFPETSLVVCDGAGDAYVRAVESGPADGYDLVVVDGLRRAECLRAARLRVKPFGLLLLDDSERPEYAEALRELVPPEWSSTHFPGPKPANIWPVFTRTTVLRRAGP